MIQIKLVFSLIRLIGDFKYLAKGTASDKVLRDKAFNIRKNPKYFGYQVSLLRWINVLIRSLKVVMLIFKQNEQLAEELHKPNVKKLYKKEFVLHLKTIFGVLIQLTFN